MGKKISELDRAASLNNGDLFVLSQVNAQSETGYKSVSTPVSDAAQKFLKGIEFPTDLNTSDKTIIGAINEANESIKSLSYKKIYNASIASFNGLQLPLRSLSLSVTAKQSSGSPTPESPLPISGKSAVHVFRYGKGFLEGFYSYSNWKADLVSVGSLPTSSSNRGFVLPVESGKTYTISFGISSDNIPPYIYLCKSDLTTSSERVAYITSGSAVMNSSYTFTADNNTWYLRTGSSSNETSFLNQVGKVGFIMLEEGSGEDLSNRKEYVFDLGDTYFGGELSVLEGKAEFDSNVKAVNLSNLTWAYTNGVFTSSLPDGQMINVNGIVDYMCDTYTVKGSQSSTAYSSDNYVMWHGKSATKNWVFVRDNRYTSAADFTDNVTGMMTYISTTSEKHSLSPVKIASVEGENYFKSDEGPLSLEYYITVDDAVIQSAGNVLLGKKWAVCGDSFTNGVSTAVIGSGKYYDQKIVYPYIIGNRNNMEIVKFFDGGMTLAFPASPGSFTNSLTNPSGSRYYQNIPADVDYITIYLGINDEHHSSSGEIIPLGTISDSTTDTYLGAYNVVLAWLMANRPQAHIGIIITNGIENNDNYRQGQIAIAKKYGLPYIDLNGDARTPAMIRTSNPDIDSSVKQILLEKWRESSSNPHPNDKAHIFESTFIEEFLRSI